MSQTIEGFRLSPQQARLWFLQRQSDAYRSYCSLLLEGHLDVEAFVRALEMVLTRHEMCRTSFQRLPGVKIPVQYMREQPLYTWRYVDLRNCQPQEQQTRGDEILHDERRHAIDIEHGPLLHCCMLSLAAQKHVFQVSMHALHADSQSLYAFVRELANLYASTDSSAGLDDEVVQYVQFSEWQNTLLESEDEISERERWRTIRNRANVPDLPLPFERKSVKQEPFIPGSLVLSLTPEVYAHMNAALAKLQISPSLFLLTCWQIVLWRLTGHREVLIGLGLDGRVYDELAGTIGPMAKYLPLMCSLHEDAPFHDLLSQVRDACNELQSLQPYFNWADLSHETDSFSASLLYPFGFDFREQPALYTTGGVSFAFQQCYSCSEPCKVSISALQSSTALTLEFRYDTGLFDLCDIQLVAGQFITLLESAALRPEAPINALSMMSDAERKLALVTFNQTDAPYPAEACFHHLFESQVMATPDALALQYEEAQITYDELNRRANQLAHHLQTLGVGSEVAVGIYLERSIALLVGVLGVLKAGGVYIPLDPIYPQERLAFVAKDAQFTILLTSNALHESFPAIALEVLLDRDWPLIARQSGERSPASGVVPDNLAYIIYTSGSTGQPKGVMIPHRGLVQYINWCSQHYRVEEGSGSPVHSPLAFDLTITALFRPLVLGAR